MQCHRGASVCINNIKSDVTGGICRGVLSSLVCSWYYYLLSSICCYKINAKVVVMLSVVCVICQCIGQVAQWLAPNCIVCCGFNAHIIYTFCRVVVFDLYWYPPKLIQSLETVTQSSREAAKLLQRKMEDMETLRQESAVGCLHVARHYTPACMLHTLPLISQ